MAVLMTGATGMLGRELVHDLIVKGQEVKILARDIKKAQELFNGLEVLKGDVTEDNLGLKDNPRVKAVYHLAALLDLGDNHHDDLWNVNVIGTQNVIKFMKFYDIPQLYFCSTAYTQGKNAYEASKWTCEKEIVTSGIKYVIFKPSIIIGSPEKPGTAQNINQVALIIAKVHRKAETARKKVEDTLALPPIELGFRIRGEPQATLNLIPVSLVAETIAHLGMGDGVYYITNPHPLPLPDMASEVGEALGLNIHIDKEFKASLPELILERLIKPFLPYLQGEPHFPTVVDKKFRLAKGYVRETVKAFLKS